MFLTHFLAPKPFMTQLLESSRGIHWLPMLQEHRQCDFRSISGFLQILVIQTAVLSPNYTRYRSQMHEFGVLASERTHLCLFRMSGMTLKLSQLLKGQQGVFDQNMRFLDDSNSLIIEISIKYPPGVYRNSIFLHSCMSMMPWGSARVICALETALNTV